MPGPDRKLENEQLPTSRRRLSKDTLNLIIASCAVLISAASFVAAYMQSDAAYRQVKAETWPYLQIENSNYDPASEQAVISYTIANVGVGPANLKSFTLQYEGQRVKSFYDLVSICCATEKQRTADAITSSAAPAIIPVGDGRTLFWLPMGNNDETLWSQVNKARHKLEARACYCSLLGDCYKTDFESEPTEVKTCKAEDQESFRG